jgi:hypothetical protein
MLGSNTNVSKGLGRLTQKAVLGFVRSHCAGQLFKASDHTSGFGYPYGAAEPILRLREKTVSKHFAVRVASLRMVCRGSELIARVGVSGRRKSAGEGACAPQSFKVLDSQRRAATRFVAT